VIVCDGFIGNVALKVSEGVVDITKYLLQQSLKATITRQIGYVLSRAAFADFRKRVDYSEYGGAPLLGIKGVCIICHGRSNANAIKNAIRVAAEFATGRVNQRIEEGCSNSLPLRCPHALTKILFHLFLIALVVPAFSPCAHSQQLNPVSGPWSPVRYGHGRSEVTFRRRPRWIRAGTCTR
jgi:hypothetical protein